MTPPTQYEQEREKMMEKEAEDLPFGRSTTSGRGWGIAGVAIILGLAIPLFYVGLSIVGAILNTQMGIIMAISLLFALVVLGLIVGAVTIVRQGRIKRSKDITTIMTKNPIVCGTVESLEDCAKSMYRNNVGCIVVQDEKDRFIGMVTDRDIICGGVANGMDLRTTPITLVMVGALKSVSPRHSLEDVIRIMREEGLRRVPVIEAEKCLGIISIDDLITNEACSIEDLSPILREQLSEPSVRNGVKSEGDRAA